MKNHSHKSLHVREAALGVLFATIGAAILYPMVGLSGLFYPIDAMPQGVQVVARLLPLTYAVSLLKGIWIGNAWLAPIGDGAALALATVICLVLSSKVFRWE